MSEGKAALLIIAGAFLAVAAVVLWALLPMLEGIRRALP